MNSVMLIGRLTSEPDVRQGQYGAVVHYTLAVDRGKNKQGEQETDFPRCVCFGKSAEFAMNYLHKGMKIAVEGFIKTGSYQGQNGQTVYTTEVQIHRHEFCEKRSDAQIASNQPQSQSYQPQQNYPPQNNYQPNGYRNGSGYPQQQYHQQSQQYRQAQQYQQPQYAAPLPPAQQPMPQGFEEVISDQPLPF